MDPGKQAITNYQPGGAKPAPPTSSCTADAGGICNESEGSEQGFRLPAGPPNAWGYVLRLGTRQRLCHGRDGGQSPIPMYPVMWPG